MTRHRIAFALCILFVLTSVYAQQVPPPTVATPQVAAPATPASQVPATQPGEVIANQPAVPTTEVPSPAAPNHSTEQAQWALGVVMLLEYLKKSKYVTFIQKETSSATLAVIGFITAVATALTINISISGNFWDPSGADITFAHVSWVAFKDVAWQWIVQQGWYVGLIKRAKDVGGLTV